MDSKDQRSAGARERESENLRALALDASTGHQEAARREAPEQSSREWTARAGQAKTRSFEVEEPRRCVTRAEAGDGGSGIPTALVLSRLNKRWCTTRKGDYDYDRMHWRMTVMSI